MCDLDSSGVVSQSLYGRMGGAHLYVDIGTRPHDSPNEIFYSKGQPTSWCLPVAGVKEEKQNAGAGCLHDWVWFCPTSDIGTARTWGTAGWGGWCDILVTGAVWLTGKLCEVICKSDLLFWQSGSCWDAISDVKWVNGGHGVFVHKSRYGCASPSLATMCSSNSKDGHASLLQKYIKIYSIYL